MKNFITYFSLVLLITAGQASFAGNMTKEISPHPLGDRSLMSERAIAERIKPAGKVCIKGQECEIAAVASAADTAPTGPRSAEEIYGTCAACHASGAAGAPKLGDKAAWSPRIAKGLNALVKTATTGINAMPPKGMCMDCSDAELKSVVEYMVNKSK